jgi:hypothetical protein
MKSINDEIKRLRILGGKEVPITRIKGTDNIRIGGRDPKFRDWKPVYRQIGGNVGLSAETIIMARKRVLAKRQKSH